VSKCGRNRLAATYSNCGARQEYKSKHSNGLHRGTIAAAFFCNLRRRGSNLGVDFVEISRVLRNREVQLVVSLDHEIEDLQI